MPLRYYALFLICALPLLFGTGPKANAQFIFDPQPLQTRAEFATISGTPELPFWLYANQYGQTEPGSSMNALTIVSAHKRLTAPESSVGLHLGSTVVTRISDTNNSLHYRQLYGGIEIGFMQLQAGRFHSDMEAQFPDITVGSMMVSRNATPHPRYMLSTRGFVDVPFTSGFLQFRGTFSDGVLERDRVVERPFVHQKTGHFKFNYRNVELIAGLIHNVIWAGTDDERGRLPQSFSDYLKVVFPRPADDGSSASIPEQENRLGNAVAAYDGALIITTSAAEVVAYRQIYLEDTVSARTLRSYMDGLYGLGLRNISFSGLIDDIVLEHVNTVRQDAQGDNPRGRANYYNHYNYESGWSYEGNVIGNPLLTYDRDLGRVRNNMVVAWHLGLAGNPTDTFSYQVMGTYSRNYGTCRDDIVQRGSCWINSIRPPAPDLETTSRSEIRQDQYSFRFTGSWLFNPEYQASLNASLAMDAGEYFGTRYGFMLGVSIRDFYQLFR